MPERHRFCQSDHFNSDKDPVIDMHESTLDAPMMLLCAVVRGIIERKDLFVLEFQVSRQQGSMLERFEEIAQGKCAVTVNERAVQDERTMEPIAVTVLELKHLPWVDP